MNFAETLEELDDFFRERGVRFAIIGGLALQSYGLSRSTFDVDVVAPRAVQQALIDFLESRGYETLHVSEGYSNHVRKAPPSRLDFVFVDPATEEKLFARCQRAFHLAGRSYEVPHPEHLIAMKVLAMKNDSSRRHQELADIAFLMSLPGVDRQTVREYFEKHQLLGDFDELRP